MERGIELNHDVELMAKIDVQRNDNTKFVWVQGWVWVRKQFANKWLSDGDGLRCKNQSLEKWQGKCYK